MGVAYVTSQSFAVLVNGCPEGGWIRPQRGIKQGCPLAPMLFVLAADVLAISTSLVCGRGSIRGLQTPSQPLGIPLLQYADDTLFFIEGSVEEAKNLAALLRVFADCSGLHINREKSEFVGFGLLPEEGTQCVSALETPGGLGVPDLDTLNVALLTKWVTRIVGPDDDLIKDVVRDRYGSNLGWENLMDKVRGESAFWRGMKKVFPLVREFFWVQLGNGAGFRFWMDNWTSHGRFRDLFPHLYALARHWQVLVEECWDGVWCPTFAAILSNQRVEDFLSLQQILSN
ncbi:uncharacterized protein LOC144715273 [Wolffia australiana]